MLLFLFESLIRVVVIVVVVVVACCCHYPYSIPIAARIANEKTKEAQDLYEKEMAERERNKGRHIGKHHYVNIAL